MKRSSLENVPGFYHNYINNVGDKDLMPALEQYGIDYLADEKDKLKALSDNVYAPGKWTVKQILQHLIDAERIFAYRALRIARADKTPLPGFDENTYADEAAVTNRTVDDLLEEYNVVRTSTIMLFKQFTDEQLMREGISNNSPISVWAIGFIIVGHTMHHVKKLQELYYPLLNA